MMPSQGLVATATDGRSLLAASPVRVSLCIFIWLADHVGEISANVAAPKAARPMRGRFRQLRDAEAETKTQAKAAATLPEFKHGDWPFTPLVRPAVPQLQKLSGWVKSDR